METPLATYVHHLLDLHDMFNKGKGDTDESDEIRDKMDAPWHNLTSRETKVVNELSAALHDAWDRQNTKGESNE